MHRHHGGTSRRAHGPARFLVMIGVLLFWASWITCFLWALHRIARALETIARTRALKALEDDLSDQDRRTIAEYVRHESLRRF
jgi:hypothetical protein